MASKKNATVAAKKITSPIKRSLPPESELNQYRQIEPVLVLHQIRRKAGYQRAWDPGVATRRRNAASSGEIRHIRRSMIELPAESNVLARHVIEGSGCVP